MSNVQPKSFIEAQTEILTVINVLIPKPEEQDKVVSLLQKGMNDTMQQSIKFYNVLLPALEYNFYWHSPKDDQDVEIDYL